MIYDGVFVRAVHDHDRVLQGEQASAEFESGEVSGKHEHASSGLLCALQVLHAFNVYAPLQPPIGGPPAQCRFKKPDAQCLEMFAQQALAFARIHVREAKCKVGGRNGTPTVGQMSRRSTDKAPTGKLHSPRR